MGKEVAVIPQKNNTHFGALSVLLTAVLILLCFSHYTATVQSRISRDIEQHVTESADLGRVLINAKLDGGLTQLEAIADTIGMSGLNKQETVALLDDLQDRNRLNSLTLAYTDGIMLRATDSSVPIEWRMITPGLAGNRYISECWNEEGRAVDMVMTVPVRLAGGRLIGALSAVYPVSQIEALFDARLFNGLAMVDIVDRRGAQVAGPDGYAERDVLSAEHSALTLLGVTAAEVAADIKGGRPGMLRYRQADGETYFLRYAPLRYNDWYLLLNVPAAVASAQSAPIREAGKLLLIEMLCLVAALIAFLVWRERRIQAMLRRRTEQLRLSEERYRLALQYTPNAIWEYDFQANEITYLSGADRFADLPAGNLRSEQARQCLDRLPAETAAAYLALHEQMIRAVPSGSAVLRHGTDSVLFARLSYTTVFDQDGAPLRAIGAAEDVTDMIETIRRYRNERSISDALTEETLAWYNINVTHDKVEHRKAHTTPRDDLFTRSYNELLAEGAQDAVREEDRLRLCAMFGRTALLSQFAQGATGVYMEYQAALPDGSAQWVALSARLYREPERDDVLCVLRLVNIEESKQREMQLIDRAERDPLTGLFNRAAVEHRVRARLASAPEGTVLFIIDLDYYKGINDTLGHTGGDRALLDVAAALRSGTREEDLLGRFGGDEFMLLLCGIPTPAVALQRAESLLKSLRRTYRKNDAVIELSASIGLALSHGTGESFEQLFERADRALYRAKERGRNCCELAE